MKSKKQRTRIEFYPYSIYRIMAVILSIKDFPIQHSIETVTKRSIQSASFLILIKQSLLIF